MKNEIAEDKQMRTFHLVKRIIYHFRVVIDEISIFGCGVVIERLHENWILLWFAINLFDCHLTTIAAMM